MTTTPNPTAEQIVQEVLKGYGMLDGTRVNAAEKIVATLRAHGLLSEPGAAMGSAIAEAEDRRSMREEIERLQGLLPGGAPSEESAEEERLVREFYATNYGPETRFVVERVDVAVFVPMPSLSRYPDDVLDTIRKALIDAQLDIRALPLTAAGIAPQKPNAHADTCFYDECVECKPAPPTDREKLIAEAQRLIEARGRDRADSRLMGGLIALAAPLDPKKVADYLGEEIIDKIGDPWTLSEFADRFCAAVREGKLT